MRIIKKNLLYADKIASTSNCMAKQVKKLLDSDSIDIGITPFGVDIEKFSRKSGYKTKENIYIGNIKTLAPKYGISDLIKAVSILRSDLEREDLKDIADKIKLFIYGDGNQKEELINLVQQYNLQKVVEFKGKIPNRDVPKALEELDIFCVTSIQESFGVSVVEAMAMELPVVATDVDGFKEVVDNGVTGIVVERKNSLEIAKALKKLILNENMRLEMGKRGRERVLELYDWERNVDVMEKLYNDSCILEKR